MTEGKLKRLAVIVKSSILFRTAQALEYADPVVRDDKIEFSLPPLKDDQTRVR